MFVNRQMELAFLDSVLERERPSTAQLLLLYGRRRVGKTVLLRHWAEATGLPHTYWAADKEPSPLQRRKLPGQGEGSSGLRFDFLEEGGTEPTQEPI